jgi:hypothetical protein
VFAESDAGGRAQFDNIVAQLRAEDPRFTGQPGPSTGTGASGEPCRGSDLLAAACLIIVLFMSIGVGGWLGVFAIVVAFLVAVGVL